MPSIPMNHEAADRISAASERDSERAQAAADRNDPDDDGQWDEDGYPYGG